MSMISKTKELTKIYKVINKIEAEDLLKILFRVYLENYTDLLVAFLPTLEYKKDDALKKYSP